MVENQNYAEPLQNSSEVFEKKETAKTLSSFETSKKEEQIKNNIKQESVHKQIETAEFIKTERETNQKLSKIHASPKGTPEISEKITKLRSALENDDEDESLMLIKKLSNDEKRYVLNPNNGFLNLMAEIFSADTEMVTAMESLGANLKTTIEWLIKADWASKFDDLDFKTIRMLIEKSPLSELLEVSFDDELKKIIVQEFSDADYSVIINKIEKKLDEDHKKRQKERVENKNNSENWMVKRGESISKIAGKVAEKIKAKTQKRVGENWLRLDSTLEVLPAIKDLNPKVDLENIREKQIIRVPNENFWNGFDLSYYTGLTPNFLQIKESYKPVKKYMSLIPQNPTLIEAREKNLKLPELDLEQTRFFQIIGKGWYHFLIEDQTPTETVLWIVKKLGPFQKQLKESASRNNIPIQLLATIITTELGDIGIEDVYPRLGNSTGIAQISPQTAVKDRLIDNVNTPEKAKELLKIPQYCIEAAAREISFLLKEMIKNKDKPWQKKFGFTASNLDAKTIYNHIDGDTPLEKEMNLANLVGAAYNTPQIIKKSEKGIAESPNGTTQGEGNSASAMILYKTGIFH